MASGIRIPDPAGFARLFFQWLTDNVRDVFQHEFPDNEGRRISPVQIPDCESYVLCIVSQHAFGKIKMRFLLGHALVNI